MTDPRLEWHGRHVPPEPETESLWEFVKLLAKGVPLILGLIGAGLVLLLYIAFDVE